MSLEPTSTFCKPVSRPTYVIKALRAMSGTGISGATKDFRLRQPPLEMTDGRHGQYDKWRLLRDPPLLLCE